MTEYVLSELISAIQNLWPEETAEAWDQVGLSVGADAQPVRRVLIAVDAVRATVDEAIEWGADVLVTHHPLLLRGIHTVSEQTAKGALIASLVRAHCALITAHTNADIALDGVSDAIADALGLSERQPIVPTAAPGIGTGRVGQLALPITLREVADRLAAALPATVAGVRVAGDPLREISRVALCGGAGDSLLNEPSVRGADLYVTSDLRHHPAQDSLEQTAVTGGPALIDISHWAAESLWLRRAANQLRALLPGVEFRVSTTRTDPWQFSIGATSEF